MSKSVVLKHNIGFLSHLPVGSIIAWHRDFEGTPALPPGWVECNGQTLDDTDSPYNGKVLPDLNGQGRFLRGAVHSGDPQADQMQSHTHSDAGHEHPLPGYFHYDNPHNIYNGITRMLHIEAGRKTETGYANLSDPIETQTGGGVPRIGPETRPVNMSVVWIMKVKQVTAAWPSQVLQAEEQAPPGAIYVSRAGNVGIGTDIPTAPLTIKTISGADIFFTGGGEGYNADIHSEREFRIGTINSSPLSLLTDNQFRLTIAGNGNVGIGTSSPGEELHVHSNTTPSYGFGTSMKLSDNFQNWTAGLVYDNGDKHFAIGSGSTERLVIRNSDGNVGIGTTEPGAKLEVAGTVKAAAFVGDGSGLSGVVGGDPSFGSSAASPNNAVFVNDGGKVGIGTTPGAKLHLKTSSGEAIRIQQTTQYGNSHIDFHTFPYADRVGYMGIMREPMGLHLASNIGDVHLLTHALNNVPVPRLTVKYISGNVGIGTMDPGADKLDVRGRCYAEGGWHGTNSDYAEYFESTRATLAPGGTSVVLTKNGKIRPAKKDEIPVGVVSDNPAIVGNSYKDWPKKYLRDEFGNVIMEEYQEEEMVPKKEKVTRERQKMGKKTIEEDVTRVEVVKKGKKYVQKEITETVTREVEEPVFKEVNLYDESGKNLIGKHRIPVMETYEEEIDVLDEDGNPVMVGTGEFVTRERPKLNPDYDESKEYIPRDQRPEWNCVGLLGQLPLFKGQPVAPTWVKIKDISEDVELWLVK